MSGALDLAAGAAGRCRPRGRLEGTSDLREFRCAPQGDVWSAKGTVENSTGDDQVYYVRIGMIEGDESR
jgi:hypothetical protein